MWFRDRLGMCRHHGQWWVLTGHTGCHLVNHIAQPCHCCWVFLWMLFYILALFISFVLWNSLFHLSHNNLQILLCSKSWFHLKHTIPRLQMSFKMLIFKTMYKNKTRGCSTYSLSCFPHRFSAPHLICQIICQIFHKFSQNGFSPHQSRSFPYSTSSLPCSHILIICGSYLQIRIT